ncbi:hypothetical protein B4U79_01230 [Dinothrombium tinctorium]|uniref:Uncharacterized protein n=1 Tax=Dinothrombium tinctorium TaxID=1965070 RepID=A0A443R9W9_9ACAR|nr:hypothetical protein B4U79_01230 [Dinothrombium tinctorium]
MRDGIFVKDVMSRGPANESGKVKAGKICVCDNKLGNLNFLLLLQEIVS